MSYTPTLSPSSYQTPQVHPQVLVHRLIRFSLHSAYCCGWCSHKTWWEIWFCHHWWISRASIAKRYEVCGAINKIWSFLIISWFWRLDVKAKACTLNFPRGLSPQLVGGGIFLYFHLTFFVCSCVSLLFYKDKGQWIWINGNDSILI